VLEDTTVWEIADLLGLPRQGPFVVVAAESTQIAQEALPRVDAQLRIRGIGSAWRLLPELHVGIIRLPDAGHLGQLTTVLTGTARARVGVLLQTLAAWRDNAGSATATARQMFCHPNTIRQRLRKLESCTGRSLSDPRATAELFLALEAILLLPPS
jgi:hypothetical protein